jgi:hypothetical protein
MSRIMTGDYLKIHDVSSLQAIVEMLDDTADAEISIDTGKRETGSIDEIVIKSTVLKSFQLAAHISAENCPKAVPDIKAVWVIPAIVLKRIFSIVRFNPGQRMQESIQCELNFLVHTCNKKVDKSKYYEYTWTKTIMLHMYFDEHAVTFEFDLDDVGASHLTIIVPAECVIDSSAQVST